MGFKFVTVFPQLCISVYIANRKFSKTVYFFFYVFEMLSCKPSTFPKGKRKHTNYGHNTTLYLLIVLCKFNKKKMHFPLNSGVLL